MRLALAVVLMVSSSPALAQADLWSHVNPHFGTPQLATVVVSDARLTAIRQLLREHRKSIGWECGGEQLEELLKSLTFESIPLSSSHEVLLVEAGSGCARGGQGANGAMWLVRFSRGTPELVATPRDGFNGWIFAIQPSTSHGLRDIILGWRMGVDSGSLNYFKFDGKTYRGVGSATYEVDENDKLKIQPIASQGTGE
jgi:hypothetical protein